MRIGVFGGTFDPPHLGHLILAAEACDQLDLHQVLWVLTPNPPHKTGRPVSALANRLALLQAALQDNPAFILSRIDIDRPPPHYAADTMQLLRRAHPATQFIYLMGADSLVDLPTWHAPQHFVEGVDEIGVMRRLGENIHLAQLEGLLPGLSAKVRMVVAPLVEISSTDIRRRLASGRSVRYFLPGAVWRLIEDLQLYR